MQLDKLYNILQVIGSILLGLTFIVGALTVFAGIKLNKVKDKETYELKREIKEVDLQLQKEKTNRANAEAKLVALQKIVNWRHIDQDKFVKILSDKPKGKVQITYIKDDAEAYILAYSIRDLLVNVNWEVSEPSVPQKQEESGTPFTLKHGGILMSNNPSLSILVNSDLAPKPYNGSTPLSSLMLAFTSCGITPIQVIPYEQARPPKGVIRILVGHRY